MGIGDIRPFVDTVAIATKGRVTTYKNGVIRKYVDSVALRTAGRTTTYMDGEEDILKSEIIEIFINTGRLNLKYDNSRLNLEYNNTRFNLPVSGVKVT